MIKYRRPNRPERVQKNRPQGGGGAQGRLGLTGTTEWLRLLSQPTISISARCSFLLTTLSRIWTVDTGRCPTTVAWFEKHCPALKVSNFEQTIAVHICWTGNYRGIALSGPNPAPPSIIGLGGVVLSGVSSFVNFESEQNGTACR
jgi:hypothetical protein